MVSRIQQTELMPAEPRLIYDLLTSAEQFSAMTGGAPAEIDPTAGGEISLFDGMITGRTIEAVEGERVVQAWRPQPWAPGTYSIVKFEIEPDGAGGSRVTLDHTGFPEDEAEHLAAGWTDNYWNPMRAAVTS
ncbi:MAG: SRPBCC domain-containing protein [Acidimicrobiales bacterium]